MATGEWAWTWFPIIGMGAVIISALISYAVGRSSRHVDLGKHCNSVASQLTDQRFHKNIRRTVLAETAIGLLIQQEIDRVSDLTYEEFLSDLRILSQYDPQWPHEWVAEKLRGAFTKDNVKEVGKKVLDKIIGLANKAAGIA